MLYTEWLDQDGLPLPEALGRNKGFDYGLTARLLMLADGQLQPSLYQGSPFAIVAGTTDAPVIGNAVQFGIAPGLNLQFIRLDGTLTEPMHYYLQVQGRALAQEASPHAQDPSEFDEFGANEGLLERRMNHYTPILTPRYDEAATRQARQARQVAGEDPAEFGPVYRWVRRPEYQFSLIDLQVQQLNARDSTQQWRNLLAEEQARITTGDELVQLMYRLILGNELPLPGFDTPNSGSTGTRQWVFALGEEEC